MREIVFDTETTGLEPDDGDRIVEIGASRCSTASRPAASSTPTSTRSGRCRPTPMRSTACPTISCAPSRFSPAIAEDFETFIGDAPLVAHNAGFDFGFLNAELARLEPRPVAAGARPRHPGARPPAPSVGPNSLDALCRRYGIDNPSASAHGALLDAELLAEVYLELIGGRQTGLVFADSPSTMTGHAVQRLPVRPRPNPLPDRVTAAELAAHAAFVATLGRAPLWDRWGAAEAAQRLASG